MPQRSIDARLRDAHDLIENVLANPDLLAVFATAGRDAAYFERGRALYERARDLHHACNREHAEQVAAGAVRDETYEGARKTYMKHLTFARIALEDEPLAVEALDLDEHRERSLGAWLSQADQFYAALLENEDYVEAVADFDVTTEDLAAARAAVAAVAQADRRHQREMDDARLARLDRDALLEALNDWIVDTRRIARVVFDEDPRLVQLTT